MSFVNHHLCQLIVSPHFLFFSSFPSTYRFSIHLLVLIIYSQGGRVNGVLVFNTSDEMTWGCANVREKFLFSGPGVVANLGDLVFELLANVFLHLLELGSIGPSSLDNHVLCDFNGVTGLSDF